MASKDRFSKAERAAELYAPLFLLSACPKCHAAAGDWCVKRGLRGSRTSKTPHRARAVLGLPGPRT